MVENDKRLQFYSILYSHEAIVGLMNKQLNNIKNNNNILYKATSTECHRTIIIVKRSFKCYVKYAIKLQCFSGFNNEVAKVIK